MCILESEAQANQEMETTPPSFQTIPDVEGRDVGNPEAQAVEPDDPMIEESMERGIEHSALSPFCSCKIVTISLPVNGWGNP